MTLQTKQLTDRNNNFNLLRIVAASAVLFSHAYPLSLGPGTPEPLTGILGISLGTLGVLTFFAISGYFISQSFDNRHSIVDFTTARAMRIYPGLFAVLVLTVFALGPMFTKFGFSEYFADRETLFYIPRNLRLWPLQYDLPGVFGDNPYPGAINGSLWTLAYEVGCYALVALVGMVGLALSHRRFTVFLIAYALFYIASFVVLRNNYDHLAILQNIHLLVLPFVLGMALYQFRQHMPLRFAALVLLGIASGISYGSPWFHELFVLTWSYGVFYLGFFQYPPLLTYNRLGDYSYGMYIYAFPVEQVIAATYKGCAPVVIIMLSLPFTLLFAVLSWHYIEKRALAQKSILSAWVRGRVKLFSANSL